MEHRTDEGPGAAPLRSTASEPFDKGITMHIRIVTFGLAIPVEACTAHALEVAPGFAGWPAVVEEVR